MCVFLEVNPEHHIRLILHLILWSSHILNQWTIWCSCSFFSSNRHYIQSLTQLSTVARLSFFFTIALNNLVHTILDHLIIWLCKQSFILHCFTNTIVYRIVQCNQPQDHHIIRCWYFFLFLVGFCFISCQIFMLCSFLACIEQGADRQPKEGEWEKKSLKWMKEFWPISQFSPKVAPF